MSNKMQEEFMEELATEFKINKDTFCCYTLESNPQIKLLVFGQQEWETCYIGFLINKRFHVLGIGSISFINEDAKALYVALTCTSPQDEQKLKVLKYSRFDEDEQASIKEKFKQIFSEQ